jgi:hypothetical protein
MEPPPSARHWAAAHPPEDRAGERPAQIDADLTIRRAHSFHPTTTDEETT